MYQIVHYSNSYLELCGRVMVIIISNGQCSKRFLCEKRSHWIEKLKPKKGVSTLLEVYWKLLFVFPLAHKPQIVRMPLVFGDLSQHPCLLCAECSSWFRLVVFTCLSIVVSLECDETHNCCMFCGENAIVVGKNERFL